MGAVKRDKTRNIKHTMKPEEPGNVQVFTMREFQKPQIAYRDQNVGQ